MKKINLKGISEILSERELKNIMGGSNICFACAGFSGNPYVCTSGDCIDWASENCIYGWTQWTC